MNFSDCPLNKERTARLTSDLLRSVEVRIELRYLEILIIARIRDLEVTYRLRFSLILVVVSLIKGNNIRIRISSSSNVKAIYFLSKELIRS